MKLLGQWGADFSIRGKSGSIAKDICDRNGTFVAKSLTCNQATPSFINVEKLGGAWGARLAKSPPTLHEHAYIESLRADTRRRDAVLLDLFVKVRYLRSLKEGKPQCYMTVMWTKHANVLLPVLMLFQQVLYLNVLTVVTVH